MKTMCGFESHSKCNIFIIPWQWFCDQDPVQKMHCMVVEPVNYEPNLPCVCMCKATACICVIVNIKRLTNVVVCTDLWDKEPQPDSAAPMGDKTTSIMTQLLAQPHYPDTGLTNPCPILVIPSARLGSEKHTFCKPLVWFDQNSNSRPYIWEACTLLIWPPRPVTRM